MFSKQILFLVATSLALSLSIESLAQAEDDLSTVPVSAERYKRHKLEVDELKISVIPSQGYVQSSIPVGYPRCLPGSFCPDHQRGNRVSFWFIALGASFIGEKDSEAKGGATGRGGFAISSGLYFARRLGHGYYEFRDVAQLTTAQGKAENPRNTMEGGGAIQGTLDNAVYASVFDDNLDRHPLTPIVGLRVHAQAMPAAHFPRTIAFNGALQLGAGFVLNREELTYRATGNLDVFRTAIAMLDEDEFDSKTRDGANAMTEGFKGWAFSNSFSSGPVVLSGDLGQAFFAGPAKESLWHGALDLMVRVTPDHGLFLNLSTAFTRLNATVPPTDANGINRGVNLNDFVINLGGGVNAW